MKPSFVYFEQYRSCGCVSESVASKRELPGYCGTHGSDVMKVYKIPNTADKILKLAHRTLWTALCWNDHNYTCKTVVDLARQNAEECGIVDAAQASQLLNWFSIEVKRINAFHDADYVWCVSIEPTLKHHQCRANIKRKSKYEMALGQYKEERMSFGQYKFASWEDAIEFAALVVF